MVLRRIKDRTRLKFNVAIAEVGDQDAWQQAQIGFAVVANERPFVESIVDKVCKFIEDTAEAKVIDDEKDFVVYGDENLSFDNMSHWEPDEPSPPGFGQDALGGGPGKEPGRRKRPQIKVRGSRR